MTKVKICGITNLEDALFAAGCGADALGFVFFSESPRYIDPVKAGEIIDALPPFISTVGVFADADENSVKHAVNESGVGILQFHGSEGPEYCSSFGMPYLKAFKIRGMESLDALKDYRDAAAFLLDTYSEKEMGGTGVAFNWDIAVAAKPFGRIILAGGLTPENVAEAVRKVAPYAVDVSSGVEAAKGKKDPEAVRKFILAARAAS
jgi:phosphoribosylanthranilate isomerase